MFPQWSLGGLLVTPPLCANPCMEEGIGWSGIGYIMNSFSSVGVSGFHFGELVYDISISKDVDLLRNSLVPV